MKTIEEIKKELREKCVVDYDGYTNELGLNETAELIKQMIEEAMIEAVEINNGAIIRFMNSKVPEADNRSKRPGGDLMFRAIILGLTVSIKAKDYLKSKQ